MSSLHYDVKLIFVYILNDYSSRESHAMQSTRTKPKKAKGKGIKFRKIMLKKNVDKGRNWTEVETETFCRILADPEMNFCTTLETKALKKTANKEVFESIQIEFKICLLEEEFIKENRLYFDLGEDDPLPELDTSIPKLRNKYNNLKKQWRQRVDRDKTGSGLDLENEAKWFQNFRGCDHENIYFPWKKICG